MTNHDHNQRRLPPQLDEKLLDNQWRNGKTRQEPTPRPPKGEQLRNAGRNGKPLDWSDINSCFADLWQEARLVIWRAKHSKSGIKFTNPATGKQELTFIADEKTELQALDTCTSQSAVARFSAGHVGDALRRCGSASATAAWANSFQTLPPLLTSPPQ